MTRRRNIQLAIGGSLLLISLWLLGGNYWFYNINNDVNIEQEIARIHDTYGVEIGIGDPGLFFTFSDELSDTAAFIEMEPASETVLPTIIAQVESAIRTYPEGVFSRYSETVFIVGNLKLGKEDAGGTYVGYFIVIAAKLGHPKKLLTRAIHHEFSSMFWVLQPSSRSLWQETLPEGWQGKAGAVAQLQAKLPKPSPKTGFLSGYGQTSAENDFNVYAEFVFVEPKALIKLAKKHPIIAKKLGIFISAYLQADPRFIDYFDKTGLSDVAILPPPEAE
jgi:hypothetical protein